MNNCEKNIKKLSRTNILMKFVKSNNGCWDHQKWEEFCNYLKEKKYDPIDFDQVGLLLEEKKAVYWKKRSN